MNALNDALELFPAPARTSEPRRDRHLAPVAQPRRRRRPRIAYALVALAGAVAIAAAQMGLSLATTEASYDLRALTAEQSELTWQKQELTDSIAGLSSPQYLAANAESLGMVIDQSPSFLRLSDGQIVGTGKAARWRSSVSALGKTTVANALIAQTPLVTDPDVTITSVPVDVTTPATSTLPPPITDGLPTPTTR